MEANIETPQPNGKSNGHLLINKESRSTKTSPLPNGHISTFDPNKYMLNYQKGNIAYGLGQVRENRSRIFDGGRLDCLVQKRTRFVEYRHRGRAVG